MNSIREIYKYGFGPSSSHTIGPTRAAEFFLARNPGASSFTVELYGSLAATGRGHQTDLALLAVLGEHRTEIIWKPEIDLPEHPNGMTLTALGADKSHLDAWTVFSIGGGDLMDREGRLPKEQTRYRERTLEAVLEYCRDTGFALWEYVYSLEEPNLEQDLSSIWQIMKKSIQSGLENEGVLPGPLKVARKAASYFVRANTSSNTAKSIGLLFTYALAVAAGKAYECAMYALYSDGRHKISFDQVVETMRQTGLDMQSAYRETGVGGLAKHKL